MMNTKKKTNRLIKVLKLIKVLQKCNSKATVGSKNALVSPKAAKTLVAFCVALLCAGVFALAYFTEPFVQKHISVQAVMQALMILTLITSFMLSIKNIVNVLYAADDLSVLLPLPFSAGQIVSAKLAVSSRFPVLFSIVLMNTVGLGFGLRAGLGFAFALGTILASVLLPVSAIAAALLLVSIVFRVFGFIRNRDITVVLGGLFTIVLMIGYSFLNAKLRSGDSSQAKVVVGAFSTIAAAFPSISFMGKFMFSGSIAGLFISLGISFALVAVALLAVKAFYLSTALAMQNTATNQKSVTKEELSKEKRSNALKALTMYEARSAKRNPAYLIYGFAMSLVWPVLVALPVVLGNKAFLDRAAFPLSVQNAFLSALFLSITASCFSCGFNILPGSAFSREGSNFRALRAMPVGFKDYYKSKRNFAMIFCSIGSVGYILVLGIVCLFIKVLTLQSSWVILYSAGLSFLLNIFFVNAMMLKDSKKPHFNWESETEISRKLGIINILSLLAGTVALVLFFISLSVKLFGAAQSGRSAENMPTILIITVITIVSAGAIALLENRHAIKKAEKNLSAYE